MRVVAGRHEHQLRPELVQHGLDDLAMHQRVVGVGRSGFHRHVHREATASTLADLLRRAGSGIEGKLVSRDVQHARLVVEHRLRSVAVVHVDVDDGNALETAGEHRGGRDGDVVEEAEAHRPIRFGVVPRWTHERERGLALGDRVLRRLNRRARREPSDFVRVRRRERVGVEHHRLTRRRGHPLDVRLGMYAQELFVGGWTWRNRVAAAKGPPVGDSVEHVRSFDALGMPWRGDVPREERRGDQNHV